MGETVRPTGPKFEVLRRRQQIAIVIVLCSVRTVGVVGSPVDKRHLFWRTGWFHFQISSHQLTERVSRPDPHPPVSVHCGVWLPSATAFSFSCCALCSRLMCSCLRFGCSGGYKNADCGLHGMTLTFTHTRASVNSHDRDHQHHPHNGRCAIGGPGACSATHTLCVSV